MKMIKNSFMDIQSRVLDENDHVEYDWFYDIDNECLYRIKCDKVRRIKPYKNSIGWMELLVIQSIIMIPLSLRFITGNSLHINEDLRIFLLGIITLSLSLFLLSIYLIDENNKNYEKYIPKSQRLIAKKSDVYKMWRKNKKRYLVFLFVLALAYADLFVTYLSVKSELNRNYSISARTEKHLYSMLVCFPTLHLIVFLFCCSVVKFIKGTKNKDEPTK